MKDEDKKIIEKENLYFEEGESKKKKNKKKGVHGQRPVWTPFFFMFF